MQPSKQRAWRPGVLIQPAERLADSALYSVEEVEVELSPLVFEEEEELRRRYPAGLPCRSSSEEGQ